MAGMSVLFGMGVLIAFFIILFAVFIYMIIAYLFESSAIMRFRKNLGNKKNIIAFIPFYNKYLLGKISDNKPLGIVLSFTSILGVISFILFYCMNSSFYFWLFLILSFISFLLENIISSDIFKKYSKYNVVFTVFSILSLGILRPIFLFALRSATLIDNDNSNI